MTPPRLPLSASDLPTLRARVDATWLDAARQSGCRHPECLRIDVLDDGTLFLRWTLASGGACGDHGEAQALAALSSLADRLSSDHLYAIDREGGACRVVGWAAAHGDGTCAICKSNRTRQAHENSDHPGVIRCLNCDAVSFGVALVPLSSLDAIDPRVHAYRADLLRERAARLPQGGPGSLNKGEMALMRARGGR